MWIQNGTLVFGKVDSNLRAPSCLILSHTHMALFCWGPDPPPLKEKRCSSPGVPPRLHEGRHLLHGRLRLGPAQLRGRQRLRLQQHRHRGARGLQQRARAGAGRDRGGEEEADPQRQRGAHHLGWRFFCSLAKCV